MARQRERGPNGPRYGISRVADVARGVYTSREEENDYRSRSWYGERDAERSTRPEPPRRPTMNRGDVQRDEYAGVPGYGSAYGQLRDDYFQTTTGSDVGRYERPDSHRGRGPRTFVPRDERLHELVCERLTDDHDVDATGIDVDVREGVVRLSGSVPERRMAWIAEEIAESVSGVRDVRNELQFRREREVPATWEW